MPNYDLYTELALDRNMPPTEIGALLDGRINTLLSQGYQRNSPEVDQLATARVILSDPGKRNSYEAALRGPDGVIDVTWLHGLADAPSMPATDAGAAASAPSSYDSDETNVLGARSGDLQQPGRDDHLESAAAKSPAAPSYGTPSPFGTGQAPSSSPYGTPSGPGYGEASYGQSAPQSFPSQSEYPSGGFNNRYSAAPAPQAAAAPQFSAASLSVAGRDRSESKVYLACLAVMVLGMIYPLVILFTSDDTGLDLLKGILFALAHTAVWVGLAEIIWGVRRIASPEETPTAGGQSVNVTSGNADRAGQASS